VNGLTQALALACKELGLEVEFDFTFALAGKPRIVVLARIPLLGALNGMLIFRTYGEVQPYTEEIIRAGYGYSVLDEPRPDECFDLESYKEMFTDWGWCGDAGSKPPWMRANRKKNEQE
jgi:hypothetical protein